LGSFWFVLRGCFFPVACDTQSETNRRVAGAELLGKKLEGETDSDDEGSDDEGGSDDEMGSEGQDEGEEGSGMDVGSDEDEDSSEEEEEEEEEEDDDDEEEEEELEPEPSAKKRKVVEGRKQQQQAEEGSLRQLKKAADAAKAAAKAAASISEGERNGAEDGEEVEAKTPVEYERFLTNEDFARIRALQAEATMEKALTKVGAKRARGVANEELEALKVRAADPWQRSRLSRPSDFSYWPPPLARPRTVGEMRVEFNKKD
jgi:hypothetical protein